MTTRKIFRPSYWKPLSAKPRANLWFLFRASRALNAKKAKKHLVFFKKPPQKEIVKYIDVFKNIPSWKMIGITGTDRLNNNFCPNLNGK